MHVSVLTAIFQVDLGCGHSLLSLHYTCIAVFVSVPSNNFPLKGDPSPSAEQSSTAGGGYTAVTTALGVVLGVLLAALVVIIVVTVVRRVRASRRKNAVAAVVSGAPAPAPARFRGSEPTVGFASLRSKYSITTDDSVSTQAS